MLFKAIVFSLTAMLLSTVCFGQAQQRSKDVRHADYEQQIQQSTAAVQAQINNLEEQMSTAPAADQDLL
jgi:hypothetical protein